MLENGWLVSRNEARKWLKRKHELKPQGTRIQRFHRQNWLYLLIFDDDYNFLFITTEFYCGIAQVARLHSLYRNYVRVHVHVPVPVPCACVYCIYANVKGDSRCRRDLNEQILLLENKLVERGTISVVAVAIL